MNQSERIQKYLDGDMTREELEAFKKILSENPELRKELRLHQLIDDSIRTGKEAQFRKELEEAYINYRQDKKKEYRGSRSRIKTGIFVTSIAALLIAGLFILHKPGSGSNFEEIYQDYYKPMKMDYSARNSGFKENPEDLVNGLLHYQNKNYEQCIISLQNYLSQTSADSTAAIFYTGLANMELGNYKTAETNFFAIESASFTYFKEHSRWYLGLCYLMNKKKAEAMDQFKDLAENNTVYSEKASGILKELQK